MIRTIGIIGVGVMVALAAETAALAQGFGHPVGSGLPLKITISASALVQDEDTIADTSKATTITSKATKIKFSTADIIQVVEDNNSATPTKSAFLVYSNGAINVVDGANTFDASDFVTLHLDPNEHGVWTGTTSTNTTSLDVTEKYTGNYVITFVFNPGAGNLISVSGLAKETYSIGAQGKNGGKATSDSVTLSFAGDGQSGGSSGVLTGTMKATGKGTLFP